jgi:hypothetical protein
MSEPMPTPPAADRNLLFGILALQLDFIDQAALLAAMRAWVFNKSKPLGAILAEQKAEQKVPGPFYSLTGLLLPP